MEFTDRPSTALTSSSLRANRDKYNNNNKRKEQLNSLDTSVAEYVHTRGACADACAYALCWWLLGNKTSLSNRDWPASILVPADRVNTRGTNDPVATWRGQGLPRPSQGSFVSSARPPRWNRIVKFIDKINDRTNVSNLKFSSIFFNYCGQFSTILDEKPKS